MKFKRGDIVKVHRPKDIYENPCWDIPHMDKYNGGTYYVAGYSGGFVVLYDKDGILKDDVYNVSWKFSEDWLESYN